MCVCECLCVSVCVCVCVTVCVCVRGGGGENWGGEMGSPLGEFKMSFSPSTSTSSLPIVHSAYREHCSS